MRIPVPTLATILVLALAPAQAEELKVGSASEPSAIDPHFHNLGPNNQARRHIFESLVGQDENLQTYPQLAESWRTIDDTTWEFKLRKGVKFHNGEEFTALDFIYTICRVPNVPESPSSFAIYTKSIDGLEAPDPHTLIIKTGTPFPLLPVQLANIGIISAKAVGVSSLSFSKDGCGISEWPKTTNFNDGKLTIGTGPYKFGEFVKGDRLVLIRNESYWGDKPAWEKVTFRPITSDGPRVAALLSGDVDIIDSPPIQDLPRLKKDPNTQVVNTLSNRVIYLHFDHFQEPTPGVKGTNGKNPFKDRRVREAVSKAIDRKAIVDRLMGGNAVAASQLLPPGMFGHNEALKVEPHDPKKSKALLAEAGYPDGFELIIGTPNDRYINDDKIAQAAAQMFARVGINTTVDANTKSVFFSRRNKGEFSLYLAGWGSATGEASDALIALVATVDPDKGMGGTNKGRYSNPELDALVEQALRTVDDAKREAILKKAAALAMSDYAILPLHFEVTPWALRKGITYVARADQYTLAMGVKKK